MDQLTHQQVSTAFAATTSGQNQIAIWQKTDGSTVWRRPDIVGLEDECLTISSTIDQFILHLDIIDLVIPFRDADDYKSVYDFYTIDRVEITIFCGTNWYGSSWAFANGVPEVTNPVLVYGFNGKDANATILPQLLCYDKVQMKQMAVNSPVEMSYRPSAKVEMGSGVAVSPEYSPMLNTSGGGETIEHHGVKMIPMGLTATPPEDIPLALVSFVVKQYVTFYGRKSV